MFREKIKYTDFNDVEREETYCFHISKADMSRMEFTTEGGYSAYLRKIMDEKDSVKLYETFEKLIGMSFGKVSDDGRTFIRKENGVNLFDTFKDSPAYDVLIMKLFDADYAAKFVRNIFPKDIVDQMKAEDLKQIAG